jgi:para-nitrobenzyl esterase
VVISINHQLNALGFTFFRDLGGLEFPQSGDAGVLDIVNALKWVWSNLEATPTT